MVVHLRIHVANSVTWCGRKIPSATWKPTKYVAENVVTVSERVHNLTSVKYGADGQIDRTPLTLAEKIERRTEWANLEKQVTCKKCRARMGWK